MVSTGLVAIIPALSEVSMEKIRAAVAFARECREIMRTVVATNRPMDGERLPTDVWLYPAQPDLLAEPAPHLRLMSEIGEWCEKRDGETVRLLLHIDPSKPMTDPLVVFESFQRVMVNAFADGVVGVGPGRGVTERDGWLVVDDKGTLQIDGSTFAIRREYAETAPSDWFAAGHFLSYFVAPDAAPRGGLL